MICMYLALNLGLFPIFIAFLLLNTACNAEINNSKPEIEQLPVLKETAIEESFPESIGAIKCPDGFSRIRLDEGSFSDYVRALPLKPEGSDVLDYDGKLIHMANTITAVIDWDEPSKVQQCADVAIRLHAEYLRSKQRVDSIEYNSLSGTAINYPKWLKGTYRLNSSGNIAYTASSTKKNDTSEEFEKYIQFVMTYANSASLARDFPVIDESQILPGDIYVQPDPSGRGGIGHVSVLLDICENADKERLYLFGHGFIPAQDFHLPRPEPNQGTGAWFTLDGFKDHVSIFGAGKFHRFDN